MSYPNYPAQQASGVGLASWIQRVGAYIVDAIPTAILSGIAGATASSAHIDQTTGAVVGGGIGVVGIILYLIGVAWLVYNRWYLGGTTGQSWGKKLLKLRLVKEATGQPIGFGMAFVRDLCHIVDAIICYIGFLFPLWDSKRQTLADKIVGTVVTTA